MLTARQHQLSPYGHATLLYTGLHRTTGVLYAILCGRMGFPANLTEGSCKTCLVPFWGVEDLARPSLYFLRQLIHRLEMDHNGGMVQQWLKRMLRRAGLHSPLPIQIIAGSAGILGKIFFTCQVNNKAVVCL